jgi:hypothetical protein
MSKLKAWLPAIMLAAFFLLPAPVQAGCVDAEGVTHVLQRDMPGLGIYDEVSGPDMDTLRTVAKLGPEVGSIIAYLHPRAFVPEVGFILLLVFFDPNGCAMGMVEIPQSAFDQSVALARSRSQS